MTALLNTRLWVHTSAENRLNSTGNAAAQQLTCFVCLALQAEKRRFQNSAAAALAVQCCQRVAVSRLARRCLSKHGKLLCRGYHATHFSALLPNQYNTNDAAAARMPTAR